MSYWVGRPDVPPSEAWRREKTGPGDPGQRHWCLSVSCPCPLWVVGRFRSFPPSPGHTLTSSPRLAGYLALALAALTVPAQALAEDIASLETLLSEPIVSSASKQSEGASAAPALSVSLTAEDIRRYGIRTVAEAIDFLAIAAASSDNLNGGEIGARGVLLTGDRGNHFLVLVDGNVVNDPLRGGATLGPGAGVPIELVDHIELIVGPGSVLYGSNAMLGLVSVVTKRAKDYSGGVVVESDVPTSIRAGAGIGHTFEVFGQDAELTTQLEYFKQDGPDLFFDAENTGIDGFTGQPGRNSRDGGPTGIWGGRRAVDSLYSESPSGIVRLVIGNTELHLQGSRYRHSAPTGAGDFDDPDSGETETRALVGLNHRLTVSTVLDVSARAYASYYEAEDHFIASRGVLCPFSSIVGSSVQVTCDYVNEGSARWLGLELQSTWDWFQNRRFVSFVGADARQRNVDTSSDTLDVESGTSLFSPPPGLDESDVIMAGYAEQIWVPVSPVRLSAGARVDADPRFAPVMTPRVSANWQAWPGGTLKASYSEAFRAPSWDETHNVTSHRIAADDLQPETVRSVETSVQHRLGTHRMLVGGFYSRWNDLVELPTLTEAETIEAIRGGQTTVPFTPGIQITQYRNTATVTNYGLSTGIDGSLAAERLWYGFSLTGAVAKKRTSDGTSRLPVAPQVFGNARMALVVAEKLPVVALATRFLGSRPADLADGFSPVPYAPPQVEFRLTLSGPVPLMRGLSYRAMANYAVAGRGPYAVGPVTSALPTQSQPQLIPVDRFRTTVGLHYEL